MPINTYYFDAHNGTSDPDTAWSNDANAFDGNDSTFASPGSPDGSTSSRFLLGEGNNYDGTDSVYRVRVRLYTEVAGADGATIHAAIYTESLGELLGNIDSISTGTGWSAYEIIPAPTGGWDSIDIEDLEVKLYVTGTGGFTNRNVSKVEIEVSSISDTSQRAFYVPPAPMDSSLDGRIQWKKGPGIFELDTPALAVKPPSAGGSPGDIQRAIDAASRNGGGTVFIRNGMYFENENIELKSAVKLIGEKESTTIINFAGNSASLNYEDTDVYSTGTITSITSGVMVTGSGTSWLANLTTDHQLFIGNRWYKIAAVTGNTSLILQEGYIGNASLPSSYRASKILTDVDFGELTIMASSNDGMNISGGRNITLENMTFLSNNVGIDWDYVTENKVDSVIVAASVSDGVQMNNVGFGNSQGFLSASNGGHGFLFNTLETMPFLFCATNANGGDGMNCTSVRKSVFTIESRANASQGVEFVSLCDNNILDKCIIANNTSDGLKLTATSDRNILTACIINQNGGFGINIAASTCDKNLVHGNQYTSNTSGTLSDSGTGTVSADNVT